MLEESTTGLVTNESMAQTSENIVEISEKDITRTNGTNRDVKRKKLTSIEWIAASNETINELDDIGDDYAFVQRENKRQKIEISAKRRGNKENCLNSPKSDSSNSKVPPSSSVKQPKDGKNSTETSKLRLKYEKIHANTVQKLNAQAEQLRMEISTLRTALANEQNAVRTLR